MKNKTFFIVASIMTSLVIVLCAYDFKAGLAASISSLIYMGFMFMMYEHTDKKDVKLDTVRKELDDLKRRVESLFLRKL